MRTLPTAMLRHCAVLSIPAQITGWHEQYSSDTMELEHVHLQRNAGLVQTARGGSFDMDATVRARLWYDAKISTPHGLNFVELQQAAEDAGDYLRIAWQGIEYRVQGVSELSDSHGRVHHYCLDLV